MRGILLAGPATVPPGTSRPAVSPALTLVQGRPILFHPLSTLITMGVRDLLAIADPDGAGPVRALLGDGSRWGMTIRHAVRPRPEGDGAALRLAAGFSAGHPVVVARGDHLLDGPGLATAAHRRTRPDAAHVFGCRVMDPTGHGVVELDATGRVISIEERPARPRADFAVPGLYLYPADLADVAAASPPDAAGRCGNTAVNEEYRRRGRLTAGVLPRSVSWLEASSVDSVAAADAFVRMVETRQGRRPGCPEEAAWRQGWLTDDDLLAIAAGTGHRVGGLGEYLARLVAHRRADDAVITLPERAPVPGPRTAAP